MVGQLGGDDEPDQIETVTEIDDEEPLDSARGLLSPYNEKKDEEEVDVLVLVTGAENIDGKEPKKLDLTSLSPDPGVKGSIRVREGSIDEMKKVERLLNHSTESKREAAMRQLEGSGPSVIVVRNKKHSIDEQTTNQIEVETFKVTHLPN